jgi:very-short-patch-repair endonuclease
VDELGLINRILDYIRLHGQSKAKDIADALGVDRAVVNRILYGPLRGKVRQDRDYRWSEVRSTGQAQPDSAPANPYRGLFEYYLDCLSHDSDSGVRVYADSKYDLDYVELGQWPFDSAEPPLQGEPLRRLISRQRREARKKALWLGYPTLVRHVRSRTGWQGAFLEPLLLWPQDSESIDLTFLPEPTVNLRALENLPTSRNVMEEAARLANDLGLDLSDPPPLDELAARLRDICPDWPWTESLSPAPFRGYGEVRKLSETGIYNAAVVAIAERSFFTAGLERELTDLQTVNSSAIDSSSLGNLLRASGSTRRIEGPLLEPAPLNAEQRTAVQQALTEPLTVITGPPGTGKSQVVLAILINAAWRGLRVLFASKNNKAVDVVIERMNALSPRPILLRLGSRSLQEQLAQHITNILSARPTQDDRRAYDSALTKLKTGGEALERLSKQMNDIIELRNRVDVLERAAEDSRNILPDSTFRDANSLSVSDAEKEVARAHHVLHRADRQKASFFERLFWSFLKENRQRQAVAAVKKAESVLASLGLKNTETNNQRLLIHASEFISAVKAASAYQAALKKLSSMPDTGALAAEIANQTKSLAEKSNDVWNTWTALLPNRLNEQDRTALGDYAALLRTISKADEEGGTIASAIWQRFYRLAPKTTKALPCWAVTSLSARGRVPFTAAEFDLVVIDEASQCDIASAVPLLFRGKRAVVLGDPQQLRHISRLSEQRDQALMVKHSILDLPGPNWGYRANALYDLVAAKVKSDAIIVLRDHHRSHADIINFSNDFFYGGRLRVATDYRRLKRPEGPAVRWVNVKGNVVRPPQGSAVNEAEAVAVVDELRRIALTQRFPGEMGVVTPFRAQANLIEELIARDDALSAVLASRNFICETAHRFQGDERDLILFSPVVSSGTTVGATEFLKNQGNIFNVGITRARGALIVVGDAAACAASDVKYLSAFARYVASPNRGTGLQGATRSEVLTGRDYPVVARPEKVSVWERVFYPALVDAGLRPVPQYDIDQYILDFALIRPNGRKLNIEIDGEHYHRDWDGELMRKDQLRNLRLIEMGWDVMRFWVYEVRDKMQDCVNRVVRWAKTADEQPDVLG